MQRTRCIITIQKISSLLLLLCISYVFICVCANYGEGFVGLFHQQKHHWILFEFWSMRLHISKTQLCRKECIGGYSVIRRVISLLINESLDSDIQNSAVVVRKKTCCYDRVAQCPW